MCLYLTDGCSKNNIGEFHRLGVGLMVNPMVKRQRMYGLPYAVDTGCYAAPEEWTLDFYLHRLAGWTARNGPPLFATAPDRVGDPVATWLHSEPVLPILRDLGYRAALVAQDGLVDPEWDAFDCLFIGGTTKWKLSEAAYALVAEARRRGKWTHMGRVSSQRRYLAARAAGYDSCDGTFVTFGPDIRLPEVGRWMDHARDNPTFWEVGEL
jgi:hypothetical protein